MTNDNNNSNELVSDDDPTAELEALVLRRDHPARKCLSSETDDQTYDVDDGGDGDARTISKLKFDIEHLRTKWLGLEAEIAAREELTTRLNAELAELRETMAGKDNLLKTRDDKIEALTTEIQRRDDQHRAQVAELREEIDATRRAVRETPPPLDAASVTVENVDPERLARTEEYADQLRRKMQDLLILQEHVEKECACLDHALAEQVAINRELSNDLAAANESAAHLGEQMNVLAGAHAEEIRILRFELGEAQDTLAQTEDLNAQLASDLVDTRGFKEELERMLSESDERSRARIDELEHQLATMSQTGKDLEEKLDVRGDAINILLAELARKSNQVNSIGEMGDVISDIDEKISEKFDGPEFAPGTAQRSGERVTRVLVGKVGDKLLRFPLFKDRLTIGRAHDNDIQLDTAYISRRHAVVQTDGDVARVIDWGSKNGVYVNSARVVEHFLKNGDIVSIGSAHFRYEERPKRES